MDSIRITLGDRSFDARPTFRAIKKIEAETGRAFFDMASDPTSIRLTDMAIILHAPIIASGDKITQDELGEMIVEAGVAEVMPQLAAIFTAVLGPGPKEAPPAGDTKSDG